MLGLTGGFDCMYWMGLSWILIGRVEEDVGGLRCISSLIMFESTASCPDYHAFP